MTALLDRPNSALLVVDVQNDGVANAHQRDEVVAKIGALVDRARAEHVPVIWVQHADDNRAEASDGWRCVPELGRQPSEPLVPKDHGDAFEDTILESELARLRVGRLIVAGAQTGACIRATLHGAFVRGYDTVLVADAHTTENLGSCLKRREQPPHVGATRRISPRAAHEPCGWVRILPSQGV